jgi:hypothetical protein
LTAGGALTGGAPAADGIGSVISSFRMTGATKPYALGIYRDPSYVYGLVHGLSQNSLYRFTAAGTLLNSYVLKGTSTPRDACTAHVGAGYLALVDATARRLFVFPVTGGAAVTSFPVAGSPFPMNCFWDGEYYYVNGASDREEFAKYGESGAAGGAWTCTGWPDEMTYCGGAAYAERGHNGEGPYVVACSWLAGEPMCMATLLTGSLVRTWAVPAGNGNGLAYGKSSRPAVYGDAVWSAWFTGSALYAFEFDVAARTKPAVAPSSIGNVKALYR